jgi:sugar lactone lactonase YvrE
MTATPRTRFATLVTSAAVATGLALAAPSAVAGTERQGGQGGHHGDHGAPMTHIPLPNGFQPEGIATGRRHTAYLGSLANGDIYQLDLRSGDGRVISPGPGTPSVGLQLWHGLLYVAGGPTGDARVVDVRTGEILMTYALGDEPTFVNDVILTRRSAWFTDSMDNALYRVPLPKHRRHHGHHHGHHHGDRSGQHDHSIPGQDKVREVAITGEWVQNEGFNANGITTTPDRRALLVVNTSDGVLYRVGKGGAATVVDLDGLEVTNGDGLLREGRTLYAVQNQLNQVAVIRLAKDGRSGRLVDTLTSPDFDVPTTIARSGDDLYLPNARFGTTPTPETEYWVTGIDD